MRRWRVAAIAAATIFTATLALAACAASSEPQATATAAPQQTSATITVFAAASLTDVFQELGAEFESAHPGVKVNFNFAGSADLATQITEGAPADVFASANEQQMDAVAGSIAGRQVFTSNTLTIVVPESNPAGIEGIDDLADPAVKLVICAPEVPCGAATKSLADAQGVYLSPVSEENSVTDVLGKVASGEADAGIVYVTDIARAQGVEGVKLEGANDAVNLYPIGVVARSPHKDIADAFVAWVLSDAGQTVLASYGFGAP